MPQIDEKASIDTFTKNNVTQISWWDNSGKRVWLDWKSMGKFGGIATAE